LKKSHLIVNNLSKKFSRNLKRSLVYGGVDLFKKVFYNSNNNLDLRKTEFWALKNISFELKQGETLGIIGHNGAGKTTLLKLISGLLYPTTGNIQINGKLNALISLGIGFNPVLTGRENIFVCGTIMGYPVDLIKSKFDDIVSFSELEDFIDSPIKNYSSGMMARLGFSIAVSIEPQILLVDEILAVGDLNFAIKCYRRINEFRSGGGSIILVSHSPYSIRANCNRVLWIEEGKKQKIGKTKEICDEYESFSALKDDVSSSKTYLDKNYIKDLKLKYNKIIESGSYFDLKILIESNKNIDNAIIAISFFNLSGQNVIANNTKEIDFQVGLSKGKNQFSLEYDSLILNRGSYYINVTISGDHINTQYAATVNINKLEISSKSDLYGAGLVRLKPKWNKN
tara:strand:- start:13563 stop:14756 length:1194 start_codon:yes stop_codon:yes gene_type:complete